MLAAGGWGDLDGPAGLQPGSSGRRTRWSPRPRRGRDARENRDRILAAAAQAYADDGLSVSLIEIARRPGLGNATVHRNFTTDQLVAALFCGWYARRRAFAERALADPDPWHGLVSFLEDVLDGMKAEHTDGCPACRRPRSSSTELSQWSCDMLSARAMKAGPS